MKKNLLLCDRAILTLTLIDKGRVETNPFEYNPEVLKKVFYYLVMTLIVWLPTAKAWWISIDMALTVALDVFGNIVHIVIVSLAWGLTPRWARGMVT